MHRLHVFPKWKKNPYLNMLYLGARAEGWSVQGSYRPHQLYAALPGLREGDVVHMHWTNPVCQGMPNQAEARRSLTDFKRELTAAVARGVKLVWTIHNQLPHDVRYRDLEIELATFLCETAWRIIQLNGHTAQAVADVYEVPSAKLVTLRHASYLGVYPPAPSAAAARAELGVDPASPTLGFVGQIRPYKGILTLLEAAGRLASSVEGLTLLLAGSTTADHLAEVERALPAGVSVVRFHDFVPDAQLGTWFAASDLMVFPYQRVLNSGSLLLSATFGRPCVMPAEAHLMAEYSGESWISYFDPEHAAAESLARTIVSSLPGAVEQRAAAHRFAADYTTADMAWDYLRILDGDRAVAS